MFKMKVLVAQSCLILCDSMDCSWPGSSVHGILQATIPEWAAFSSPRDLLSPGAEHRSPALQADSSPSEPPGKLHKDIHHIVYNKETPGTTISLVKKLIAKT